MKQLIFYANAGILWLKTEKGGSTVSTFYLKTKIYSGENALSHLKEFPIEKALLITDRYFTTSGAVNRILELLPNAQITIFDDVKPDPTLEMGVAGERIRRSLGANILIALGGGSPMDCAKAIKALSDVPVKLICIPTTSGSGSEVTSFSILTRGETKFPLIDETLLPDAAILDPSFQQNMPQGLIAETGFDLISHCVEALAAKGRNPFSDAMALRALSVAVSLLPRSWRGENQVRGEIQCAACMAGIAFQTAGLGISHALAHALGARLHVSHGRLNAILLPAVVRFNATVCMDAYRSASILLGAQSTSDTLLLRHLIRELEQLRRKLQLPEHLRDLGVTLPNDLSGIIDDALHDMCLAGNPRPVSAEDLQQLLQEVL